VKHWPFFAALALLPSLGQGATLGVYADSSCSACVTTIGPSQSVQLFVCINSEWGFVGGRFRITGLPAAWSTTSEISPIVRSSEGDAFGEGFAFLLEEAAIGTITLMSVEVSATTDVQNVRLLVVPHVNTAFVCPTLDPACYRCESPFCVLGSPFVINGPDPCNTQIQGLTWSQARKLYR
jgi:hypothetical protein